RRLEAKRQAMNAPRDTSYDEDLAGALKDPEEAVAYIDAVMALDDLAALLVALPGRQGTRHGRSDASCGRGRQDAVSRAERERQSDVCHVAEGSPRCGLASERGACCAGA